MHTLPIWTNSGYCRRYAQNRPSDVSRPANSGALDCRFQPQAKPYGLVVVGGTGPPQFTALRQPGGVAMGFFSFFFQGRHRSRRPAALSSPNPHGRFRRLLCEGLEDRRLLSLLPTITSLSASISSSVYGQPVSFVATVTTNPPSDTTPTGGTVSFVNGSTAPAAQQARARSGGRHGRPPRLQPRRAHAIIQFVRQRFPKPWHSRFSTIRPAGCNRPNNLSGRCSLLRRTMSTPCTCSGRSPARPEVTKPPSSASMGVPGPA